jgi:tetratricopeptide (TPR) repeat protein
MEVDQAECFHNLQERAAWLSEVCTHCSADPDHYYRLGLANLELFLQHQKKAVRPAGLRETRKTLQSNHRENPEASRAWLQSRYGDDLALLEKAHAALVRSLDCCPLFGSSYLHLAKISFLDESHPLDPQPYCSEAQLVRPYDPDVHMQVGLEAWLAGDRLKARESWRRACELYHPCQSRLLPLLVTQMPAQEVVNFLPLDFEGLKWLAQTEMQLGRREDSCLAVEKARQAVEHNLTQAKNPEFWVALQELYRQAELRTQAEACLRNAVRLAPDRLGLHLLLIRWLMEDGQWRAALEHAQDTRQQFLNQPDVQALVNDILVMKSPKTGIRDQKSEIKGQKSEVGSERSGKRAGLR